MKTQHIIIGIALLAMLIIGYIIGNELGTRRGFTIGTINGWVQSAAFDVSAHDLTANKTGVIKGEIDYEKLKKSIEDRTERYRLKEMNDKYADLKLLSEEIERCMNK